MKKTKHWFNEIEDDKIREKAINNTDKDLLESTERSFYEALSGAFIWRESPEGHDYWWAVSEGYRQQEAEESQVIT